MTIPSESQSDPETICLAIDPKREKDEWWLHPWPPSVANPRIPNLSRDMPVSRLLKLMTWCRKQKWWSKRPSACRPMNAFEILAAYKRMGVQQTVKGRSCLNELFHTIATAIREQE